MAPRRVQIVLAVEVAARWRPTNCSTRDTQAYPRDEHCQSAVGSAADPWRTPQARHRYRTDQRGQVHGQAKRPAVPRLEDVPSQSCRRHRRDGSVRRTDNLVSSALRLVDCGAWSTADFMVWRHRASNGRIDRKSDHGSLRLGTSSRYLMRDRDGAYGEVFIRRLRSMGIRDRPTSPRSPWQNGLDERLIGSIRRGTFTLLFCFGSGIFVIC